MHSFGRAVLGMRDLFSVGRERRIFGVEGGKLTIGFSVVSERWEV